MGALKTSKLLDVSIALSNISSSIWSAKFRGDNFYGLYWNNLQRF